MKIIWLILFTISFSYAGNSLGKVDQSYIVTLSKGVTQKSFSREFTKVVEFKSLGDDVYQITFKHEHDPGLAKLKKSKKIKAVQLNQKYQSH